MNDVFGSVNLLRLILSNISDGTTYKNVCMVSYKWYLCSDDENRSRIDEFSNHLWTLILRFPMKNWCWSSISNSLSTTTLIQKYPDAEWDLYALIRNKNVSIKHIISLIDNKNQNIDSILEYISQYRNIDEICDYPQIKWNWHILGRYLPLKTLEENIPHTDTKNLRYWHSIIIYNPNVSLEYILDNFNLMGSTRNGAMNGTGCGVSPVNNMTEHSETSSKNELFEFDWYSFSNQSK